MIEKQEIKVRRRMLMQSKANMIRRLNAGTVAEIISLEIVRNLLRRKVIRKERLMLRSETMMMKIMVMGSYLPVSKIVVQDIFRMMMIMII